MLVRHGLQLSAGRAYLGGKCCRSRLHIWHWTLSLRYLRQLLYPYLFRARLIVAGLAVAEEQNKTAARALVGFWFDLFFSCGHPKYKPDSDPVSSLSVCGIWQRWALPGGRRAGIAALAGVGLAVAIQVAYNYYATHELTFSTYGQWTVQFDRPMQLLVLASYERGLFTYYPVLAVGLAAGLWTRRTRMATYWLSGLLAAFVTLYGFWFKWFLGGGMGHRGFVELMPFAAVIFASALPELKSRYRVAAIVLGTVFAFVTLEIMCGYWAGAFLLREAREDYFGTIS